MHSLFPHHQTARTVRKPFKTLTTALTIMTCGMITGCTIAPTPLFSGLNLSHLRGPRSSSEAMQIPPSNFPMTDMQRRRLYPRSLDGVRSVTPVHHQGRQIL